VGGILSLYKTMATILGNLGSERRLWKENEFGLELTGLLTQISSLCGCLTEYQKKIGQIGEEGDLWGFPYDASSGDCVKREKGSEGNGLSGSGSTPHGRCDGFGRKKRAPKGETTQKIQHSLMGAGCCSGSVAGMWYGFPLPPKRKGRCK